MAAGAVTSTGGAPGASARGRGAAGLVLALTLLGAALQGAAIEDKSLWGDEIASMATASGHSWFPDAAEMELVLGAGRFRERLAPEPGYVGQRLVPVLERDTQLPLYYQLLTSFLKALGTSPAAVRLLSVLASVATIPLVFLVGRRLHSPEVGLLGAALFALAPFQIAYGTFARPYSLLGLLGTASVLLALRVAGVGGGAEGETPERSRTPGWPELLAWSAVAALGLYTHYFFVFVAAFGFLLVAWHRRGEPRVLGRWLAAQVLVAAAFAPWIPSFLAQSRWNATGPLTWSYWYQEPLSALDAVKYAGRDVAQFLSAARIEGVPGAEAWTAASYGGAVLLVLLAAARLGGAMLRGGAAGPAERRAGRLGWTCLLWCACVFGGAVALDLVKGSHSIDSPRYFVCAAPAVYLAVAAGVRGLAPVGLRRAATAALLAFLAAGSAAYLGGHAHNLRYEQDVRAAARTIDEEGDEGDLVLLLNPGPNPMDLAYYLESSPDFARANVPERWEGLGLPPLAEQLAARTAGRGRVWFLDDRGPEDEGLAAVLGWLEERYGKPERWLVRNLDLFRFERGE